MNLMDNLPEEYIEQQFMVYAGYSKRNYDGMLAGGCPSCREGKSWGKKRRLFYIPKFNNIHCKNCHRSWFPINWIREMSGKSNFEIQNESKEYEYIPIDLLIKDDTTPVLSHTLPLDAINLNDEQQMRFYAKNSIVIQCNEFIRKRRLDNAINRPDALYISLKDITHKNRLCIPFENNAGKIPFYQTRSFIINNNDPLPKYLGKINGEKTLFGEHNIDPELDYIFIFEGPIDAMFVHNGVAIGGVDITSKQKEILHKFPFHTKIWVLDNQHIDQTSKEVTKQLINNGETVFIWNKDLGQFKDFNDLCVYKKINAISTKYIVNNAFSGLKAKLLLKKLNL